MDPTTVATTGSGADGDGAVSGYLRHLPAIFRRDPFIGRFLLAFETVLTGTGEDAPGLEATIGRLADYLDPMTTDPEFLPWLAGWVAVSLRADWDDATKRRFIQQVVPLYRLRGTREGLQRMLELYTQEKVEVDDGFDQPAHYFQVLVTLSVPDPHDLRRKLLIARAIIDQEKPAHTFYGLEVAIPTMRLVSKALHARTGAPLLFVGRNTLLGTTMPGLEEDPDGR
jgi:phage tail-like protein